MKRLAWLSVGAVMAFSACAQPVAEPAEPAPTLNLDATIDARVQAALEEIRGPSSTSESPTAVATEGPALQATPIPPTPTPTLTPTPTRTPRPTRTPTLVACRESRLVVTGLSHFYGPPAPPPAAGRWASYAEITGTLSSQCDGVAHVGFTGKIVGTDSNGSRTTLATVPGYQTITLGPRESRQFTLVTDRAIYPITVARPEIEISSFSTAAPIPQPTATRPPPTALPTSTPTPIISRPSTNTILGRSLCGASLVGDDGEFLGTISGSSFSRLSIMNRFGVHGSEFQRQSIWNQFGLYGGSFGSLSAFNTFASSPPLIVGDGYFYGFVTTNTLKTPRVHPLALKAWLEDGNCLFA